MHQKVVFDNKLRLVTKSLPGTKAVTVLVLVGAGSRYETKEINGISHFLEHMFFKGAEKYGSTKEVSEAIDSVGGEFNAFTGKEYAGYYVKVASEHIELALDVLSDMLLKAKLAPEDIDKERGVILEEYNMYQDTPMYQIGWAFENLIFGDQPLGWDQIGTKELIQSVTHDQFKEHMDALYTPDNIVIGISGNVDKSNAQELVHKYFSMPTSTKARDYDAFQAPDTTNKVYLRSKKTEQAHIVCGVPGISLGTDEEWPARVLAVLLGGNMSSRMFLNVREAQGLAYYIHTSTDTYSDAGILSTRAGVDTNRVDQAITAIIEQYKLMADEGVTKKELAKAQNYLKGKIVLKLEESDEYAHMLCRQELLLNEILPPETIIKRIEAVTTDQISALAQKLFQPENLHLAVIGPYTEAERFEKLLTFS